ncbi:helix-turn-helix domain-containing protein [Lichenihabitans sp. Uapishka_5]|uniref:ArsR/SmtB family transcription factor n=1 Tax=Lichenihabitans sp. Uapishka_5 TaxID=3037302 RepID=UPI0029E80E25|nr:helix-turn-helix domain-containing protein [Lichenihabitans sp. Uapishka_5]MDX7952838.1 helix-turn-helix domain-containing protein [Lichenihabitans sp. Uapishka_5]
MRPLAHPALEDITLAGILHALADETRAAIFVGILGGGCAQRCAAFATVSERTVPKSTLSQHFRALREAGLIRSERQGVEMLNSARCAEIETRFPGLLPAIVAAVLAQAKAA